jgi:Zn finger protein HypA/HybF involved in hydrogenase expression
MHEMAICEGIRGILEEEAVKQAFSKVDASARIGRSQASSRGAEIRI